MKASISLGKIKSFTKDKGAQMTAKAKERNEKARDAKKASDACNLSKHEIRLRKEIAQLKRERAMFLEAAKVAGLIK